MNRFILTATAAALTLGAPAFAASDDTAMAAPSGDVAAGEAAFGKQCVSCHVVKSDDGELLAGRNGRQGPNLFGVAGGKVGSVEGFKYGKALAAAGEAGNMWDEENFVAYVQDPTDWLRKATDDKKARSRMGWKVRDPQEAADLYAYLYSIAPAAAE
ncbi:c-type cytochrome [Roseovarius arcticus]|uniref:c-type cytochrome n=1 Tax=Roseovarius arcticus TaxID=2547404 RepID=UPI0011106394|nr:c-type cytochrome [Roseovarius arcticus]